MRERGVEAGLKHEYRLMVFAEVLARSLRVSTIHNYLSAVRSLHVHHLGEFSWGRCVRLPRLLAGIKRRQQYVPRKRAPVTIALLHEWHRLFDFSVPDHVTLWAALLLAFFALLRKSEFSVAGGKAFDPARHLSRGDVSFHQDEAGARWMEIHVKFSKTEQFGADFAIPVARSGGVTCPYSAMVRMLHLRPHAPPAAPLFVLGAEATALSSPGVTRLLQTLVRASPQLSRSWVTPHSLRIGGTLALQEAGASELVLQVLGRWRSDCYKEYLRYARGSMLKWSRRMASAPPRGESRQC